MRRFKIGISYIGSRYSGFQKNSDATLPSVQARVEVALARYLGGGDVTKGAHRIQAFQVSSRTDAGVHALGNVFHVDLSDAAYMHAGGPLPHASHLVRGLNSILSQEHDTIVITDASEVGLDFCARRSCTGRRYVYKVMCPSMEAPDARLPPSAALFHRQLCHVIDTPLDVQAMQQAALLLLGEKDFSSFRNAGCQSHSSFRNLTQLDVESMRCNPVAHAPLLVTSSDNDGCSPQLQLPFALVTFTLSANAFLLKMVRNLVGVLLEVGENKLDANTMRDILDMKDRSKLRVRPAPANGLALVDVLYDGAQGTRRHVTTNK